MNIVLFTNIVAVILMAIALPLFLKRIKPNSLFSFRTAKTKADPELWFEINSELGRRIFLNMALQLIITGPFSFYLVDRQVKPGLEFIYTFVFAMVVLVPIFQTVFSYFKLIANSEKEDTYNYSEEFSQATPTKTPNFLDSEKDQPFQLKF